MQAAPVTIAELVAAIPDGSKLALAKDTSGVPMAAIRALIRRGVRDLHLVCVPTGGLPADLLIGAGCVKTLETSAVTLGEFGTGPRFVAAIAAGTIRMLDATCPAIYAALQAAQKGIPFMPLRGIIGTDVLGQRDDWRVIQNPFAVHDDPIVLLSAIQPDFALVHALKADRDGNVFVGRDRELLLMAQAATQTLVTVEEVTEDCLLDDEGMASGTIPAIYVSRIALANSGAWPLGFSDRYALDETTLGRYAALARNEAGFRAFLEEWLNETAAAA